MLNNALRKKLDAYRSGCMIPKIANRRYRVLSAHHTEVCQTTAGLLAQRHLCAEDEVSPVRVEQGFLLDGISIVSSDGVHFHMIKNELYGCCEPDRKEIIFDRVDPGPWELFRLYFEEVANVKFPIGTVGASISASVDCEEFLQVPCSLEDTDTCWYEENSVDFYPIRSGERTFTNSMSTLDNGYLLTKYGAHGSIFDQRGSYNNNSFGFRSAANFSGIRFEQEGIVLDGNRFETVAYLDGHYSLPFDGNSFNYYHFLIDGVVQLVMLRQRGCTAPPVVFCNNNGLVPWQRQEFIIIPEKRFLPQEAWS